MCRNHPEEQAVKMKMKTNFLAIVAPERKKYKLEWEKQNRKKNVESQKFYCEVCDKAYQNAYSLNRHFNNQSHIKNINPELLPEFRCSDCDYCCNRKCDLTAHIKKGHLTIIYTCDICDWSNPKIAEYNRHCATSKRHLAKMKGIPFKRSDAK